LRPKGNRHVIDLVREAGVDVTNWDHGSVGKINPSTNPKYCYEWAFVQEGQVVVLNLWHEDLSEKDGVIFENLNPRRHAEEYKRTRRQGGVPARSMRMDAAIQTAFDCQIPVRVIILAGKASGDPWRVQEERLEVKSRMLDPMPWSVTFYDQTSGDCVVTRGTPVDRYSDQFSINTTLGSIPTRKDASGKVWVRSETVRRNVRERAQGKCEWCGQPGFQMENGSIYVETHHIIPLSEEGLDSEGNVVAICPNHHRQAHHGQQKADMRQELLQRVTALTK